MRWTDVERPRESKSKRGGVKSRWEVMSQNPEIIVQAAMFGVTNFREIKLSIFTFICAQLDSRKIIMVVCDSQEENLYIVKLQYSWYHIRLMILSKCMI